MALSKLEKLKAELAATRDALEKTRFELGDLRGSLAAFDATVLSTSGAARGTPQQQQALLRPYFPPGTVVYRMRG